jgi:anti-sigma B factor antagonist
MRRDVQVRLETDHSSGCTVAYVSGDLDFGNAHELVDEFFRLAGTTADRPARVVLDFEEVGFLDSSGIGAVVRLWKALRESGGDLGIAHPPRICWVMMTRTGLARYIAMGQTVHGVATRLTPPRAPSHGGAHPRKGRSGPPGERRPRASRVR